MKRITHFGMCTALVVALVMGCGSPDTNQQTEQKTVPTNPIEQVLEQQAADWMAIPGVSGVAIGESDGRPCIKVYVTEKTDDLAAKIPDSLEGHPVVIEVTGEFEAL